MVDVNPKNPPRGKTRARRAAVVHVRKVRQEAADKDVEKKYLEMRARKHQAESDERRKRLNALNALDRRMAAKRKAAKAKKKLDKQVAETMRRKREHTARNKNVAIRAVGSRSTKGKLARGGN